LLLRHDYPEPARTRHAISAVCLKTLRGEIAGLARNDSIKTRDDSMKAKVCKYNWTQQKNAFG
jgi:hypothetical protein